MRIGAVTIGQAPRDDVMPELRRFLESDVKIAECGALDDLTIEEVGAHAPVSGESALVSRMRDGTEVTVEKNFVLPRLQENIHTLENEVELILLLCTAPFDNLQAKVPLLRPGLVLESFVAGMAVHRLGLLTPSPDQVVAQHARWRTAASEVVVESASPYGNPHGIEDAATRLARTDVDLVVMDCIGYTNVMKAIVRRISNKPALTATGMLGRVVAEMLE